ncbi:branched-chain amino acid ABC transporter substrate-binding protein, partial [Nonomuraea turkmeniaca]
PRGVYGVGQWFPGCGGEAAIGVGEREFVEAYRERAGTSPGYPAVQAAATAIIAAHCVAAAGSTERGALWTVAGALETTTLYGTFKIDPRTGAQAGHRTTLTRWETGGPAAIRRE